MSEPKSKPLQAPDAGAQQASPADNAGSFQRAENLLAAGNEASGARSREALAGIENRPAADRASKAEQADVRTGRAPRYEGDAGNAAEQAADDKVDDALDEKAREEGVKAAEDSSRIEWGLTPHNI